jgi:predicted ATP-grasp superfamily ATP-dependent carboligase
MEKNKSKTTIYDLLKKEINMSAFVTDGDYKHTLGIIRSLGKKGLKVDVGASQTRYQIAACSKFCNKSFEYPDPKIDQQQFIHYISNICKSSNYEAVIPVGYNANFVLSKFLKVINSNKIPLTDFRTYQIAANKALSIILAREIGVPVPDTIFVKKFSCLRQVDKISYPVVVKGVYEGGFVRYAYNKNDLKNKYEELFRLQGTAPIIQEFVKGGGYGFFALFNNGNPRAIFMHKRIREQGKMGGPSTCAESFFDPQLLHYGLKILKKLEWHGVAMVEFKKDIKDNLYKLMEINPKFWGSLDLSIACGVDFPFLLYKMIIEGDIKPVFTYKNKVRYMWPIPDDLQHVFENPKDLRSFVIDLFNPRVMKNIDINDLNPLLFTLGIGISNTFQQVKR